jgi:hypothetical protein
VTADGKPPNIVSAEYTQWLEGLPARIETFSVMNTLAFPDIIKALIVVWMVGIWCGTRRFDTYRREKSGLNFKFIFDIGVASLVCFLAMHESLKRCIFVIVWWAAILSQGPAFNALMLALGLAFSNCMVAAICITTTYTSLAVLLLMAPWRKTRSGFPTYAAFRASLRRVEKSKKEGRAGEEEEECIVCQSSDELLLRLPCWETHMVCDECLDCLHDANQSRCPATTEGYFGRQSLPFS